MQNRKLTLYTNPKSRGSIAHWMVEETGAPYEAIMLEFGPQMKSPEYLRLNPMGKVPTIVHGDKVVTEAAAICCYLADAFPDAKLAPPTAERSDYYRWLFFAAGPVEAAVTNKALGLEVPLARQGMVGYGSYDLVINTLSQHLKDRPFVCGDKFTAADVYVGAQLNWGLMFGSIPSKPEFQSYVQRVTDRPAYQRSLKQK
jgi:glutathione S-transferase